jgi:SAM-dependent methyltransferase
MAHPQQQAFCESVKARFPQYFSGVMVLDIGSLDINGNNQCLFDTESLYLGIDVAPGPNVDIVCPAHELGLPEATFDTLISTECLEHDRHWMKSLHNAIRMLRPGGLLLVTCATTGRKEHGTRRTTPQDAPLLAIVDGEWADYYRNLDENDIRAEIDMVGLFQFVEFSVSEETHDLYLCAIKHGTFEKRLNRSINLNTHPAKLLASNLQAHEQNLLIRFKLMEEKMQRLQVSEKNLLAQLWATEGELRQVQAEHLILSKKLATHCKSWHANLLRFITTKTERFYALAGRVRNGLGYIGRRDFEGLRKRLRSIQNYKLLQTYAVSESPKHWAIMATPHTLFVAHLIASRLRLQGWEVDIITDTPSDFPHKMYVVICPQMFKLLPPGQKRIVYQMEQSVSSRWFTDHYFKLLEDSLATLEYSLVNIEFMASKGLAYPRVHYLPVGADAAYVNDTPAVEKTSDVLFYGDFSSSPRRREMLATLGRHFQVRTCNEVFGADMIEEIRRARVVINLHYYENALLETTRIQECLSLGVPVVSEVAQDQADYPELTGAITFFRQGDEQAMVEAVHFALSQPAASEAIKHAVTRSSERFAFMFDRFLMAVGLLPPSKLMADELPLPHDACRVALSMPETIARRRVFEANRPQNCAIFDGLRFHLGWVGCGLSYSSLGRHALKYGIPRIMVLEDDVLLPVDFEDKMRTVEAYLDLKEGQWDVFAGLIALVHSDVKVLRVETFQDMCFMTIDKMTSMVCNIYSKKAQRLLAWWDPDNQDALTNTIDKYLEHQANLRVIVPLPFLVGHREEAHSTLWGIQNTRYREQIAESQQVLCELAKSHLDVQSNCELRSVFSVPMLYKQDSFSSDNSKTMR